MDLSSPFYLPFLSFPHHGGVRTNNVPNFLFLAHKISAIFLLHVKLRFLVHKLAVLHEVHHTRPHPPAMLNWQNDCRGSCTRHAMSAGHTPATGQTQQNICRRISINFFWAICFEGHEPETAAAKSWFQIARKNGFVG